MISDLRGSLDHFFTRNASQGHKEQVRPGRLYPAFWIFSPSRRSSSFVVATLLTSSSNNADILYLRFGREIESFTESLQQLEAVIDHANRQRPRRPFRNHNDECRHALQPLSQLVGDFKKTLDECEKLLNDHERFKRDTAGFVDNVVWHVSTQRDVDILRERVHFHATKVATMICPGDLSLLTVLTYIVTCR